MPAFRSKFPYPLHNVIFGTRKEMLNNPSQIEKLPNGTEILILNPSGEINVWTSKEEAISRQKEGAVIIVGRGSSMVERNDLFSLADWHAWLVVFHHYQNGNKSFFVTYGDVGVKSSEIKGVFSPDVHYKIEEIPQIKDPKTGRIVCPVIRMPKYFEYLKERKLYSFEVSDPDFWLDEAINLGAEKIIINKVEDFLGF